MHRVEAPLVLLRPGDREHAGMYGRDLLRLGAHAAGDDDLAVLGHGGADGGERFRLRAVEKAAGIDDDEIGAGMVARQLITLRPQPGDDALGIDQCLRAAERNEGNAGGGGGGGAVHLLAAVPSTLSLSSEAPRASIDSPRGNCPTHRCLWSPNAAP